MNWVEATEPILLPLLRPSLARFSLKRKHMECCLFARWAAKHQPSKHKFTSTTTQDMGIEMPA